MGTFSSNTTIKMDAAVDTTSITTSATQFAILNIIAPAGSAVTVTHTGGAGATSTVFPAGADGKLYGPLYLGPGNTLAISAGRLFGVTYVNTP